MATTYAALSPVTFSAAAKVASYRRITSPSSSPSYIVGLDSFGGLKAENKVGSLGLPVCTERSFAKIVSALRSPPQRRGGRGGAFSATCNATAEIFKIAAIMNALVLVGVAVGFVLLRIEAYVEESE